MYGCVIQSNPAVDVPFSRLPCVFLVPCYTQNFRFAWYNLLKKDGGDEENRTPDPLLARQVLSQLSYAPILCGCYPQN